MRKSTQIDPKTKEFKNSDQGINCKLSSLHDRILYLSQPKPAQAIARPQANQQCEAPRYGVLPLFSISKTAKKFPAMIPLRNEWEKAEIYQKLTKNCLDKDRITKNTWNVLVYQIIFFRPRGPCGRKALGRCLICLKVGPAQISTRFFGNYTIIVTLIPFVFFESF